MLYPLKFYPILKEKIWGGNKLNNFLNKTTSDSVIGESWEISTVNKDVSVVSNGVFSGIKLDSLIQKYKGSLLGNKVYNKFGDQFPLLIKFIDAKENLSVQLHPSDKIAKKRHNSFGKTEMWYVIQADIDAQLIVGFNRDISQEEFAAYLTDGKLIELLNFETISKGDAFLINAGKIHAICGGSLIAEIQQTSDITYRVYDWDRKDDEGNYRELHTELALEALDLKIKDDYVIHFDQSINMQRMVDIQYFTTNKLNIQKELERNYTSLDSFVILMCVEGVGKIKADEFEDNIKLGDTILLPASVNQLNIFSDHMELLEIYIK